MSHVTLQQADLMLKSIKGAITNGINNSVADWSQNDSGAQNYIKNRPFYEDTVLSTVFDETFINIFSSGLTSNITINEGETYTVVLNGTEYSCQSFVDTSSIDPIIGFSEIDMTNIEIDAPFQIRQSSFSIRSSEVTEADGAYSCTLKLLDSAGVEIIAESTFTFEPSEEMVSSTLLNITVGKEYQVTLSGQTYNCTAFSFNGLNALGNEAVIGGTDNGLPFLIVDYMSMATMVVLQEFDQLSTYNIKIEENVVDIHTIDEKFLPQISWNNLSDRPFYKEGSAKELFDVNAFLAENDLEWEYFDGTFVIETDIPYNGSEQLTVGEKYTCIINGTEYISTAVSLELVPGMAFPAIGDVEAYINQDLDNFTYIFMAPPQFGVMSLYKGEMPPTEFRILKDNQIIKKLDPIFLPDGGFGYEESSAETILEETELKCPAVGDIETTISITDGETYTVTFNGQDYSCVAYDGCLGNGMLHPEMPQPIGEDVPFLIVTLPSVITVISKDIIESCTLKIADSNGNEILATTEIALTPFEQQNFIVPSEGELIAGETYTVIFDGQKYSCTAWFFESGGFVALGNGTIVGLEGIGEDVPFLFAIQQGMSAVGVVESAPIHTIEIIKESNVIHQIDPKFLPDNIGGVTSWNDLMDRPFYEEKNIPLPEKEIIIEDGFVEWHGAVNLILGETYQLVLDGETYECVCDSSIEGILSLETEQFTFTTSSFDNTSALEGGLSDGVHTLKIIGESNIVKLDPVFLPEGGVGYEEIIVNDVAVLFDDEITTTDTISDADYPVYYIEIQEPLFSLEIDKIYNVTIDDIAYNNLTCFDDEGYPTIGSIYEELGVSDNIDYPFTIFNYVDNDNFYCSFDFRTEGTHTVKIVEVEVETIIHKIDSKFLPDNIGGGVTSWNDLTDKPFYEEEVEVEIEYADEIFNETISTISTSGTNYPIYAYQITDSTPFTLVTGNIYNVTIDAVDYKGLVAAELEGAIYIGSADVPNVENPQYPFLIVQPEGSTEFGFRAEGPHNVIIELVREPETIYDDIITTNMNSSEGTYPVYYVTLSDLPFELEVGKFYDVVIDEITYNNLECFSSESFSAIGTDMVDMTTLENPPYPFFIGSETTQNTVFFASRTEGEHNVKITESNKRSAIAIHHIEAKFIPPLNSMTFIDAKTGYEYIGYIYDGNFITFRKYEKIELTKMPDKLSYVVGEKFDPTGMVITGTYSDGTSKEIIDFDYEEFVSEKTVMIYCVDGMGQIQIDLDSVELLDFVFTRNADGTYTLTGWKGTLNCEPSTEMIIPDRDFIVL